MNNKRKQVVLFIRGVIASILVLGIGYAIYSNFIKDKGATASTGTNLAPNFILIDLKGNEVNLEDYRGKGVLLNFWATYCPPCEKEMPYLESAYKDYKDKGIEILAVDVGEPRILVDQFVSKKGLSFPVLLDWKGDTADLYKVQTLPITVLINEKGEIVDKITGEMTEEAVRQHLDSIVPK